MIFDSHCHIQFNAYKDDVEVVLKKCLAKDVLMIVVGSQCSTSQRAVEYAEKYPGKIWAAVGIHPLHLTTQEVNEEEVKFITREERFNHDFYWKLARHPQVTAIGETGLEYFHKPEGMAWAEFKKRQSENFIAHCQLADELNLPIIVHCREAHDDQIKMIKEILAQGRLKKRGVVHCFTGNWPTAEQYLRMGFYIGFTGIITFPTKKNNPQPTLDLLEAVEKTPLDRILIETDAPYLAPQAYRGQRCEPWMVEEVAKKIAEIKGLTAEETARQTAENTQKLFGLGNGLISF